MRIIAVDHGEKRIGLAVSDPAAKIARPLGVVKHTVRQADARAVHSVAREQGAELIVVGESFDEMGRPNAAGRRAERFAEVLRESGRIPVVMWDESLSTQDARAALRGAGLHKKRRMAPLDAQAAAVILQSYLDAQEGSAVQPAKPHEGN